MKLLDYGVKPIDCQNPHTAAPAEGLSRRIFVMTSLATSFAVASEPVLAQAIQTDAKGLVANEVSLPVTDGKILGSCAMPEKPGKYPVLLVVQEHFGVHEHIKDMRRRFAKMGYYAIAPAMYARQGDVSKMTDIGAILSTVVAKVPDAQVNADLDAAVAFAKASGSADAARLSTVGYCWGGRAAWVYALHNKSLRAVASYDGLLDGMKSEIKPRDPVGFASEIKVPVLGLCAGIDGFVKPEVIDKTTAGLRTSGSDSEIVVFPNVNHGFNADYRPTYDKVAATYATRLTLDWLNECGV